VSPNHEVHNHPGNTTVLAIQQAQVVGASHTAIIFFGGGFNALFISEKAAKA